MLAYKIPGFACGSPDQCDLRCGRVHVSRKLYRFDRVPLVWTEHKTLDSFTAHLELFTCARIALSRASRARSRLWAMFIVSSSLRVAVKGRTENLCPTIRVADSPGWSIRKRLWRRLAVTAFEDQGLTGEGLGE